LTNEVSEIPLRSLKRTKIIATLGPQTDNYVDILNLIKTGANGLRLNASASYEDYTKQIQWIRKAAKVCNKPVAIIFQLQGPQLKLGEFDDIVAVRKNQVLAFEYGNNYSLGGNLPVAFDFSKHVIRGQRLLLSGGKITTSVTAVSTGIVYGRAENDGILIRRASVNLPDSDLAGNTLTPKDRKDLAYASDHDIDYVVAGFVQTARDIEQIRRHLKNLGSPARIIAKIETRASIDNLEEIISVSDAVMIALSDLAVETEPESVPIIQQSAIGLCLRYAKTSIVESQLMSSLRDTAEPSRSEAAELAAAVLSGADCLLISESAAGLRDPVETVAVMKRVIRYIEANAPLEVTFLPDPSDQTRQTAISHSVIALARGINAAAIVAQTKSGSGVRQLSSLRPGLPVIAITADQRTAQHLAIVYGVRSYVRHASSETTARLTTWLKNHKILRRGDIVVLVSGHYPGVVGATDTIRVRMLE
jgi:pyruvate kinase